MTSPWPPSDADGTGDAPVDHWADLREGAEQERRASLDPARVCVVLVARDGARWLPDTLDALAAQSVAAGRVIAVDAGSTDGSVDVLHAALGADAVLEAPGARGLGEAVDAALAALGDAGRERHDWLWLLHDDAAPAPDALQRLLEAAADDPRADVVGAKLREWPSLRRLLEVGVTVGGAARRETGLERGEYDQGQTDARRHVLAVATAGMLVRTRTWSESGGLEAGLPVQAGEIDLGWRIAAAGGRVVVAPEAVVFHAEAGRRGLRGADAAGGAGRPRHHRLEERRALAFVVLANSGAAMLAPRLLRLIGAAVLRALGLLLLRSPSEALDELLAVAGVLAHPRRLLRARRVRARARTAPRRDVRALLAPWWLPYRHGLDVLGDVLSATTTHAADVADRRREARASAERDRLAQSRTGTRAQAVEPDEEDLVAESGWFSRFVTSPRALLATAVVLLALVGARDALGSPAGGALAVSPETASAWWRLHLASVQPLGTGAEVAAPGYVAVLALLASVLPGPPSVAVSLLLVLAVPLALWGAWRLLGVAGRLLDPSGAPRWLQLLGALAYAVVPVTSGAWAQGRLGLVVAAAVLPWLVHAALGFADPERERRWRAAWRSGLLLTLLVAFVPFAWWPAAAALTLLAAAGVLTRRPSVIAAPALATGLPLVLLAPWWLPQLIQGRPAALFGELGAPPYPVLAPADLLHLAAGAGERPPLAGAVLAAMALLALAVPASRLAVVGCWLLAVVALVPAALLAGVDLDTAVGSTPAALGLTAVLLHGAAVCAVVLGLEGLRLQRTRRAPARAAVTGGVLVGTVVLAAVGLGSLAWFAGPGAALPPDRRERVIPTYMAQATQAQEGLGVLVVRGTIETGVDAYVRRDDGVRLGEEEMVALSELDPALLDDVRTLLTQPDDEAVERLRGWGVRYIVHPGPGDGRIRATLDTVAGLGPASAGEDDTRAWETAEPPEPGTGPTASTDALRWALLALQGAALVVALVMAGPSRARIGGRR